ncbi:hypothetical protein BDF22DRAFT_658520 [Syncephalis plumigaleata]|nr:hypothetical protein BDF22DRAFT_658520 [Syncephalis plumigaleata]
MVVDVKFHPIIASQAIEQVASPLSLTATPFSTRRWRRMFCETTERPPSPPPPPPPSPVRVRSINNWKHNDRWSSSQQRSRRLEWPVALPASYTSRLLESTLLPRPSPSIVHPRWIPVSAHWPSFALVAERPAVAPAESNSNTTATSTTIAQPVELVAPPSRSLVRAATWSPQCTSAIQSSEMSQKAIDQRDTTPSSTAATTLHSVSVESSMATTWPMTSTINDITPTDVTIISATTDINSKAIDQEQQQQQRVPSIV